MSSTVPFEDLPSDDRPRAYVENGLAVYRASASGGCVRALCAARMGFEAMDPPEFVAEAAEGGRALEPVIVDMLQRQHGWVVDGRQEEFDLRLPALVIRGHIDGFASKRSTGEVRSHILEVKTMGASRFSTYARYGLDPDKFPDYCAQVACYHEQYGLPILYVVGRREKTADGRWVVADPLHIHEHRKPPIPFDEVKRHLLTAEIAARKGALPGCDTDHQFFCRYPYLCQGSRPKDEPVVVDLTARRLAEFARLYVAARAQEQAAKASQEQARGEIVGLLQAAGATKAEGFGYAVSLTKSRRSGLDTKRLEADFGQRLDPYRTTTEYETLRVTERASAGGAS